MSVLNKLKKKNYKIMACCAAFITGLTMTSSNVFAEDIAEDVVSEPFESISEKDKTDVENESESTSKETKSDTNDLKSDGKIYNRDTDFEELKKRSESNRSTAVTNNESVEMSNENRQNSSDKGDGKIYNRDTDFIDTKKPDKVDTTPENVENLESENTNIDEKKENTETEPNENNENVETTPSTDEDDQSSIINNPAAEYMKKYQGKTIVDIEFEGASELTLPTVKVAIAQHVGDSFNVGTALRDNETILNTGYFYDLYQSFEEVPEGVIIKYNLMENPVLKDMVFSGNTIIKTSDLEKLITLRKGDVLNNVRLHDNVIAIQEKYRGQGYVLMKITDMNLDNDGILTLKISEGILEGYKVSGNKKTKDKVILREMRQKPGEVFNANLARRSMQRVNNLGFFEDVNLKMNPGVEPNAIVLEIDVKEKRTGTFGFGAGYSSADGIIGMVSITDTNFRGRGDAISIMYEKSGDSSDAHGVTFSFRRPWIDTKETAATFRVYNRTYEYDDYDTSGTLKEEYMRKYVGGEITLSRPVSEYSTNYITMRNRKEEYVRHISNGNVGDRSGEAGSKWRKDNFGTTRSITLEHVTDTRDNIYNPTTGGRINLAAEFGGMLGGDFTFQKYSIEHQKFFKAGHVQVWAWRAKCGVGYGDISEFNQFRIGGQDTLRGYRDDQFRGNRMALGTIEYRFPLFSKVQGALFTDWGSAWDDGFKPDKFHGSVGVGVALNTPLGPLRLDYGRGSQGGRVHFSVGGVF